jgi:hypothetical protein
MIILKASLFGSHFQDSLQYDLTEWLTWLNVHQKNRKFYHHYYQNPSLVSILRMFHPPPILTTPFPTTYNKDILGSSSRPS